MYITCAKKNKTKLVYKRKVIYITSPIQSYVSVALTLWKKEKERKKSTPTSTSLPGSCLFTWFATLPR